MSVEHSTMTDLILSGKEGDLAPGVGAPPLSTAYMVKRVSDTTAMLTVVKTYQARLFGGKVKHYVSDTFTSFHMVGQDHMTGSVAYDGKHSKTKFLGFKFVSEHSDENLFAAHSEAIGKTGKLLDSGKVNTDEPFSAEELPFRASLLMWDMRWLAANGLATSLDLERYGMTEA